MAEHTSSVSAQPSHRIAFSETTWDQINEPGAYLERGTAISIGYLRRRFDQRLR